MVRKPGPLKAKAESSVVNPSKGFGERAAAVGRKRILGGSVR